GAGDFFLNTGGSNRTTDSGERTMRQGSCFAGPRKHRAQLARSERFDSAGLNLDRAIEEELRFVVIRLAHERPGTLENGVGTLQFHLRAPGTSHIVDESHGATEQPLRRKREPKS